LIDHDAAAVVENAGKVLGEEFAALEFVGEFIKAEDSGAFEEEMDFDFVPCADARADADGFGGTRRFARVGGNFDEEGADHQLKLLNSSVEAMMSLRTVRPERVAAPGGLRPRCCRL